MPFSVSQVGQEKLILRTSAGHWLTVSHKDMQNLHKVMHLKSHVEAATPKLESMSVSRMSDAPQNSRVKSLKVLLRAGLFMAMTGLGVGATAQAPAPPRPEPLRGLG